MDHGAMGKELLHHSSSRSNYWELVSCNVKGSVSVLKLLLVLEILIEIYKKNTVFFFFIESQFNGSRYPVLATVIQSQ